MLIIRFDFKVKNSMVVNSFVYKTKIDLTPMSPYNTVKVY